MIIVQTEVPSLGEKYDFQIDEDTPMQEVLTEITDMICQRNTCGLTGKRDRILLWNKETGKLIQLSQTAYQNGLRSGSTLLLA